MISILMPIYNGVEFINESIPSIIFQSYTEWELLIGINGHPPQSNIFKNVVSYISSNYLDYKNKIKIFDFYHIKGKSNTLNEMIKHCKYDYIALLDVDDIWSIEKLKIQSYFLEKFDVIGTLCSYLKNDIISNGPILPIGDISKFNFFKINPIINSSVIIKKKLCHWNENGIEDYDLWLTLMKQNKKFYNCPFSLVIHRLHTDSAFNAKGNQYLVANLLKYHSSKK